MKTVLFACVHNAGRSKMAEAFFNREADPVRARAISAGTQPAAHAHPEVVVAMREAGVELGDAAPTRLTDELARSADLLVTMGCGEACPHVPGLEHRDWELADPKGGSSERVREIRDQVLARVRALIHEQGWGSRYPARVASVPLTSVAVYERTIAASLERIWENVLDWEHLPGLHRGSFDAIRCLESSEQGWRARLRGRGAGAGDEIEVEVRLERANLRYLTATTAGAGAGSEIWTALQKVEPHATRIRVEFKLPGVAPAQVDALGRGYTTLYTRLWDEDESMMVRRETMLARVAALPERGRESLELGSLEALRARLPLAVELDGRPFRVVALGDDLVAHSTVCPHLLGPLEDAAPDGDTLECPWHRYRFDLRTGRSCDGRGLRLTPAPRVAIGPDLRVTLIPV